MIKKEDKPEFIRQIMELFEDFLDEYRIKIPQKEGVDDYDPDTPANLCGKAYDDLAEHLQTFFRSWGVIKDERPQIEGYPLYSIITEFLPFSTEQKVVSTSDKADADALFEKACRDNSAVKLTVQTSSKASPAILKKWSL